MLFRSYRIQFLIIWVLGLINNLAYVVVLASCKSLAESFGAADLISILQWSNVGLGLATKIVNMVYMTNVSYTIRMTITALLLGSGITITAISTRVSFAMAVIGVLLMGSGCALGESVLIGGYFKHYDPQLTGAWSSGTGGAGVAGTVLYILFHSVLELDNFTVFLLLLPTTFIYYPCFWLLHLRYGPESEYRRMLAQQPREDVAASLLLADTLAQLGDSADEPSRLSTSVSALHPLILSESTPGLLDLTWGPDTLLADSPDGQDGSPRIPSRQLSYHAPALPYGAAGTPLAIALPQPLAPVEDMDLDLARPRTPVLTHEVGVTCVYVPCSILDNPSSELTTHAPHLTFDAPVNTHMFTCTLSIFSSLSGRAPRSPVAPPTNPHLRAPPRSPRALCLRARRRRRRRAAIQGCLLRPHPHRARRRARTPRHRHQQRCQPCAHVSGRGGGCA